MDLHRHDEASTFDGFGKPAELAKLAKQLGHTALGISNHGNTNSLVQHYKACTAEGIKPVMGVEGYFLPVYKEQTRGYHLCLFVKNIQGYRNLNELQYEGDKQKYYNPIWTFELLERYHEGLICTSACVAGFLAQCVKAGKMDTAVKYVKRMKQIFGEDFYVEVQPYKISEKGLQEHVNVHAVKIAYECGVKCILTSDSHRGAKEDFPTYLKMHQIAKHDLEEITATYKERYMPTDKELFSRFVEMHGSDYGKTQAQKYAASMLKNLAEIEAKVEDGIFDHLELKLPKMAENSLSVLKKKIKEGLSSRSKWTHDLDGLDYVKRAAQEADVINKLGFSDYFLIVADYTRWAKEQGIVVGPGRGSVCNSLVAYALGITEIDSLHFGLDFRRFLREDKKSFPDIDLDFETARRDEVIRYVINKYPGKTARVAAYGLYKTKNLVNDLAKVCGLPTGKEVESEVSSENKEIISKIKALCDTYIGESGELETEALLSHPVAKEFNVRYDNIITHFTKLYQKLRYVGTHAAGVAVTGGNILDYTSLREKDGDLYISYDLNDLEDVKVIKFDMLGLETMEEIGELRRVTGDTVDYDTLVEDQQVLAKFRNGETGGIFQFDRRTVRNMLKEIKCDCFADIVAANAMNRPGPLSSHMPESYAQNKEIPQIAKASPFYNYTQDSYGTVIYQEQIQQICVYIGGMSWKDADKVMKMDVGKLNAHALHANEERDALFEMFVSGAMKNGLSKQEAEDTFHAMEVYSFNKGHATGYSLIGMEEAYYSIYHPTDFWFCKIKHARNETDFNSYCELAVKDGSVVFLPHINYSGVKARKRKVEGEMCIQQGLMDLKNVGDKAAVEIVEERKRNGIFVSWDDFYDRCKSRAVNVKVLTAIKESGAGTFDKGEYITRVKKYNSALYGRAVN